MYFWFWIFHFNSLSTVQYKIHKRRQRRRQAYDLNLNSTFCCLFLSCLLTSTLTDSIVSALSGRFVCFFSTIFFDFYSLRTFFFPLCSSSSLPSSSLSSSSVLRKQITESLFILFLKYHCFDVACMKDLFANETLSHCRWQWQFICMRWNALLNKDDMNKRTNERHRMQCIFSDGA